MDPKIEESVCFKVFLDKLVKLRLFMQSDPNRLIRELALLLYRKKGVNIIALDVRGISSVTDFVLIATGNVERHVIALARELQKFLKERKEKPFHIEGLQDGSWVVLDYFEIVIHLFIPQMRQKYQLERLWADVKIIDLNFNHLLSI